MSTAQQRRPTRLQLRRLYCERAHFDHELVPAESLGSRRPHGGYHTSITTAVLVSAEEPTRFSTRLGIEISPSARDDQPYRVEVAYVGDWEVDEGVDEDAADRLAKSECASILMPYLRQTVADLTSRGTNGPILLQPMNLAARLLGAETDEAGE